MESYDWLWQGPYLGILRPWAQENVPPLLICSYPVFMIYAALNYCVHRYVNYLEFLRF
jgi:hypothetical protein